MTAPAPRPIRCPVCLRRATATPTSDSPRPLFGTMDAHPDATGAPCRATGEWARFNARPQRSRRATPGEDEP